MTDSSFRGAPSFLLRNRRTDGEGAAARRSPCEVAMSWLESNPVRVPQPPKRAESRLVRNLILKRSNAGLRSKGR